MIVENNEILTSASKSLYEYNSDWLIRERCRAREDFENHERNMQLLLEQAISEKEQAIEQGISALVSTLKELNQTNDFILAKVIETFKISEEEALNYL